MRKIETFEWWDQLLQVKDDFSLRELADRFKVTPGAITAAFKRTGATRRAAPPGPRSRRRPRADEVLPPEPGENGRPGSKDARLLEHQHLLGQVPDGDVAHLAGVSVRTVASYRALHGIAGYDGPRRRGADRAPRKSKIDDFAELVGTVADHVVADRANVSVNAVRNWRVKRGLSARGRSVAPAGMPDASAAVTTVGGVELQPAMGGAWKVIAGTGMDRTVRVVVARSLSAAAARAEASGLGPVLALEWIAEVLG